MKKNILLFIVFLCISTMSSLAKISNITPFIYDVKGVNAYEEVVIAYGNLGVANLSFDKGDTWDDIQIDGGQNIVNMVHKENSLVAFLEDGDVKTSVDNGKTWDLEINVNDSVIFIDLSSEFYVVRTQHSLIVLDNDFNISSQIGLEFRFKVNYNSEITLNNNPPLQVNNNTIYTFEDNQVLIYNMSLDLLEQIPIEDSKFGISRILYANNMIYVESNSDLLEIDEERNIRVFFSFGKNPELFSDLDPSIYYLHSFDNYLYSFNALQKNKKFPFYSIYKIENNVKAEYIGEVDCNVEDRTISTNDIAKFKDDFYFVSNNKFVVKYNSELDESKRISDYKNFNTLGGYLPIRIEDDKALHRNGTNYYTLDPNTSRVSKIDMDTNFASVNILYENYDTKTNELQILGFNQINKSELLLLTSSDFGSTFQKEIIISTEPLNYVQITGFEKLDDGYMIASYFKTFVSQKNELKVFDSNLKMVSNSKDSVTRNLKTGFSNNTYYRINQDTSFFKKTYLQTSPDGKVWEDLAIYTHSKADTVWLNEENFSTFSTPNYRASGIAKTEETNYLITFLYSKKDSLFTVQRIDIRSKTIDTLIHNKLTNLDNGITDAFDFYKDTLNIVVNDTLYLLGVNDDISKIEKIQFQDNGIVVQRYFRRFESRSLFAYSDDKHEYRNYWFTLNRDNGISSIEETEISPYFYNSAPYPQPTSSLVTTKVYLDKAFKLSKSSLKIFDVNGTQVEKGDNVDISGTNWPTTLTWDSSTQPPGVYFIVIDYGESSRAIKVMKE